MKPKTEFKPGDRVKIRGYSCTGVDCDGTKGVVQDRSLGLITVSLAGVLSDFKPSQLIRLKKKEKKRVWVNLYSGKSPNRVALANREQADHIASAFTDRIAVEEYVLVKRHSV